MNTLDWRNLWDLTIIERNRREARLEQQRLCHEAGVVPASALARLTRAVGSVLIAGGQRMAGDQRRLPGRAPNAA